MSFEIDENVEATSDNPIPSAPEATESSVNISKENIIYRTYGTLDQKGIPTGTAVRRQSLDGSVWEALEKDGKIRLVENTLTWYSLLNEAGFSDLVNSSDQRLFIINKGLQAIQNSAASRIQNDFDKETGIYATSDQLIDLIEDINEPPTSKRGQNSLQKLFGSAKSLSANDQAALMALLLKELGS